MSPLSDNIAEWGQDELKRFIDQQLEGRPINTLAGLPDALAGGKWVDMGSLSGGAVHYDQGSYRKGVNGEVELQGEFTLGTLTAGTVIFNLPAGYRPRKRCAFALVNGATGVVTGFYVFTNGDVAIGSANGNAGAAYNWSPIRFTAA